MILFNFNYLFKEVVFKWSLGGLGTNMNLMGQKSAPNTTSWVSAHITQGHSWEVLSTLCVQGSARNEASVCKLRNEFHADG